MKPPMLCVPDHLMEYFIRWGVLMKIKFAQCNRSWCAVYSAEDYNLACHWLNFQNIFYVCYPV